jgi:hypothetical protein
MSADTKICHSEASMDEFSDYIGIELKELLLFADGKWKVPYEGSVIS